MSYSSAASANQESQARYDAQTGKWVTAGFYNHKNVGHPTTALTGPPPTDTIAGATGPTPFSSTDPLLHALDSEANPEKLKSAGHGVNISNPTTAAADVG